MGKESTVKKHAQHGFSQFELTNFLLNNLSQFKITPAAKLVLLELSAHYNPNKPDMFPKQKTLANKIGISERSVVRAVQELFKTGLIVIECKYTNRYKFTSRIGSQWAQNEKNFYNGKLSEDLSQNDTKQPDNLAEHEPIKEPIKKPLSIEEYSKLKQYAAQRGAKNIQAYVNALIKNGSAKTILEEIQRAAKKSERSINETRKILDRYDENMRTSEPPSELWYKLKYKTMQRIEKERNII